MNEGAAKEDLVPRKRRGKPQRTIIPPVPLEPEYKPKNVGEYETQRVKRAKRA